MNEQTFIDGIVNILSMGGYWPYVWPAYLVTAAIMAGLVVQTQRAYRRQDRLLTRLEAHSPSTMRGSQGVGGNS